MKRISKINRKKFYLYKIKTKNSQTIKITQKYQNILNIFPCISSASF